MTVCRGKAIAIRLAEDGYDICVNDIPSNKGEAEALASEIKGLGRKSTVALGDVSKLDQMESIVKTSVEELGPLNTMVANAGIAQVKPLLQVTPEELQRIFEVNVHGAFNCYSTAAKQMISQGSGGKVIGAARYGPLTRIPNVQVLTTNASASFPSGPLPCLVRTRRPSLRSAA